MSKNEKNKEDIFAEAARLSLSEINTRTDIEKVENEIEEYENNSIEDEALKIVNENDWDRLSKAMDGKYAKKFMNVLESMPDRDFVRNYLKALEYFKPKITRTDKKPEDDIDRSINIEIIQKRPDGTINILTLNNGNKTD